MIIRRLRRYETRILKIGHKSTRDLIRARRNYDVEEMESPWKKRRIGLDARGKRTF